MRTITIDGEEYQETDVLDLDISKLKILKKIEKSVSPLEKWLSQDRGIDFHPDFASVRACNWLVDELEDSLKRDVFATEQIRDGAECALRKLKRLIGRP